MHCMSAFSGAPPPKTVSAEAQAALRALPTTEPEDLERNRKMCTRVQRELGEIQRKRHRVRMEESTIAAVPVRLFAPSVHSMLPPGPVLLSLHGGGFIVDAGSVTANVPVAAYSKVPAVAPLRRLAREVPFPT